MRYINASERIPQLNKIVHAKVEGKLVTGYFYKAQNDPVQFSVKDFAIIDEKAFNYIEWIEEDTQPEDVSIGFVKQAFYHAYSLGFTDRSVYNSSFVNEQWASFKAQNGLIKEVKDPPKRDRPHEQG